MKVVYLTNIPSPYRVDFFNELGKYCELTVLFEQESLRGREWKPDMFKNFEAVFLNKIRLGKDLVVCPSVRKYLKRENTDVIVVGGYSTPTGMLAVRTLKNRKIPFYLNTDGGIIKNDSKFVYRIKKHFISSATYWLSTGKKAAEYLVHYGAEKNRIFHYPFTSVKKEDILPAPLNSEQKANLRKELGIPEKKMVLSVGRFIYLKGFDVLLKAQMYLGKDTGIYLIGGAETQQYQEYIQPEYKERAHFLEFMEPGILRNYYQAADLFVLPTRSDVWGLVVNEAMANGLPVITTHRCVAGMELIEEGVSGYLVSPEDAKALGEKINAVLGGDHSYTMGCNSIEKIKNYSVESMAQAHLKIFEGNSAHKV